MPPRVLVVDDSSTIRTIVRAVLEDAGYEVNDTGDGHRALELLRREPYDLLLVDFVMPRLNGYQLALAARAIPSLRDLPIVLMSARAEQVGERFVRQTRARDAITKPFPPDVLTAVVAHALGQPTPSLPPTLVRDELAMPSLRPPAGVAADALLDFALDAPGAPVAPSSHRAVGPAKTPLPAAPSAGVLGRAGAAVAPPAVPPPAATPRGALASTPDGRTVGGSLLAGTGLASSPPAIASSPPAVPTSKPPAGPDESITSARGRRALSVEVAEGVLRAQAPGASAAPAATTSASAAGKPSVEARAGSAIAAVLAPALVRLGIRPPPEAELTSALAEVLDLGEVLGLVRAFKALDHELRGNVVLEGSIAGAPLAELFQMLRLQLQSGVLVVSRPPAEVVVALRNGNIDVALARNVSSEFLLGRYLVAGGALTREALDEWLTGPKAGGAGWLGKRLLDAKVLTHDKLDEALMRQTSEIIYELLRWTDGTFRFERGATLPEAEGARLGLPVESLVLEGFRRVDEWRLIEGELRSLEAVFARDDGALETVGAGRLSPDERAVLAAVDGERSVRELVKALSMSSFDTCKTVYRLKQAKLLRRRDLRAS